MHSGGNMLCDEGQVGSDAAACAAGRSMPRPLRVFTRAVQSAVSADITRATAIIAKLIIFRSLVKAYGI